MEEMELPTSLSIKVHSSFQIHIFLLSIDYRTVLSYDVVSLVPGLGQVRAMINVIKGLGPLFVAS
ncbi:MAG: hypothetical protein ACUVQY_01825 [Thermoproteota archaeon]